MAELRSHPVPRIAAAVGDLTDPRTGPALRHPLLDVLTIALCAIIGGEATWIGVEEWAGIREEVLTAWLGLTHGIPSHDTFGRVFARIDPIQVEAGFLRWTQDALPDRPVADVLAIDGKTVRRSGNARVGQSPLHLVSAFAGAQRLVLGQEAVADKSNEITAIPLLLERLVLRDQVVTIDAMGCQRSLAAQIVDQGGDYVLALKDNQSTMLEDVIDGFAMADRTADPGRVTTTTIEKGHGRREHRCCDVLADPDFIAWLDPDRQWPGLQSVVRVTATRIPGEATPESGTIAVRHYLSSCRRMRSASIG
jgi:predicted transposase YbfD/YdcC